MPSPRRRLITRIRSAVAVAALPLALAGTPDPASASPSEWSSASSAGIADSNASSAGFAVPNASSAGIADASASASPDARPPDDESQARNATASWAWPVSGARSVIRGFEAPATRYSAGHRGIDIRAGTAERVAAPIDGTVRFAGVVVDRATVTVETADGILVSLEPVTTELVTGDAVTRGAPIGTVSTGGHCSLRCLHLGVRVRGDYVSPMLFFGGVPRAVLLPIE